MLLSLFLLWFARLVFPLLLLGSSALLILLLLHPLLFLLTPFVRVWVRRVWLVRRLRRGSRRVGIWRRSVRFRAIGIGLRVWSCIRVRLGPVGRRVCIGRRGGTGRIRRPV